MKFVLAICTLLLLTVSCKRDIWSPLDLNQTYQRQDYVTSSMWICSSSPSNVLNGNENSIEAISGRNAKQQVQYNIGTNTGGFINFRSLTLEYVAKEPLLDSFISQPFQITQMNYMIYRVNPRLAGKEIFRTYDTAVHDTANRIYADSFLTIRVEVSRSHYAPIPLRDAINFYLQRMSQDHLYFANIP